MKEGYKTKGCTTYHGAPLDSATHGERKRNAGAERAAKKVGMANDETFHGIDGDGESKIKSKG